MMLLALAAASVAVAVPHAPRHAAAGRAKAVPAIVVRARAVEGNAQTATAFVAAGAKKYITEFSQMLVVTVSGPLPRGEPKRVVRFRCITRGCTLAPAENGNDVNRLDEAAYDVDVVKGKASVLVSVEGDRPSAVYTLSAKPITQKGERPVVATFTLTTR